MIPSTTTEGSSRKRDLLGFRCFEVADLLCSGHVLNPNAEFVCASYAETRGKDLSCRRETNVRSVEQERPGIEGGFQRLLEEQERLKSTGLSGAVGAGEQGQGTDLDSVGLGARQRLEALDDHLRDVFLPRAILLPAALQIGRSVLLRLPFARHR